MKKIYIDSASGNKVRATECVAKNTGRFRVVRATFAEPSIQEEALLTLSAITSAAIKRAHRPSVEVRLEKGDIQIGIQKGIYTDKENNSYLVLAICALVYGIPKKPTIRITKIRIPDSHVPLIHSYKKSPTPLYETITGGKEKEWMVELITKALKKF